jgi:DNA-binding transcriptional regulator LsrR (DeoR family)
VTYSEQSAPRLAQWIDRIRRENGWTQQDLSRKAQVSRPVVSRLVNQAEVPSRRSTRDAIGAAIGWEPGSCDAVLAGADPTESGTHLSVTAEAAWRLAQRIDQARQEVGLTKNDLGRIAGVSRPVVSRLINHAEGPQGGP